MVRVYQVYCGERYVGEYLAINEQSAIDQAYMKTGSASAYTGNGKHLYTVREK